MRIAVGPAPSHWGVDKLKSLYHALAQSPVDDVFVGETACQSRSCFSGELATEICNELAQGGKEVYASSLMLVREKTEHRAFRELAERVQRIEINSPGFIKLADHYEAVGGMYLNVYNSAATRTIARHKMRRIVLPCELDLESIATLTEKSAVPTEVLVHGHIPIAMSYTCNTARSVGSNGGGCEQSCRRYPEGIVLEASGRPLFRVEGPQTLSAGTYCLVESVIKLAEAGVDTVRILPQWSHTSRIVRIYRDVLDRRRQCKDALEELKVLSSARLCNGWLLGKAGWVYESPN